ALQLSGIGGPYDLVLGTAPYHALNQQSTRGGYPLKRFIVDMLQGQIIWSPVLESGVLLSKRGGDFELIVGQDISIGYAAHSRKNVELYLTESLTFRVLEPAASVELKMPS
ncbi:MAG: family 1 encapsulin nanocompartment shell protein, partial [bacterium]